MKFFQMQEYKILYSINGKNSLFMQNMIKKSARQLCFLVKNLNQSNIKSLKEKYSLDKFGNVAQYCQ